MMSAAAQRTVRDLRNDLFAKLQTLSLRFFDQRTHGELMSRLTNDVENISTVLNDERHAVDFQRAEPGRRGGDDARASMCAWRS